MRINRIIAKNFRQHKDLDLNFKKRQSSELFVIVASNGMGKSNFLNAITWCLYGEEFHLAQKSKALPIVNISELESYSTSKMIPVSVSIEFEVGEFNYTVKRNVLFKKNPSKSNPIFEVSHDLSVMIEKDGRMTEKKDDEATLFINKIVPKAINQYFFFDNEQLERYFTEKQAAESVKSSIHEISQVSLVTRIKQRLAILESEYTKSLGKSDPDIEGIREQYEAKKENLESLSARVRNLEEQNKEAKKTIEECTLYLGSVGNIAELDAKANEHKEKIEELKRRRNERILEKNDFIVRYSTLLNLYPFLLETSKYIKKISLDGSLPPKIDPDYLKTFIAGERCLICNSSIHEKEKKYINDLLTKFNLSNASAKHLVSIENDVDRLISECKQYPHKKNLVFKYIDEIERDIQSEDKELQLVNNAIEKCSDRERAVERYSTKKTNEELYRKNIENINKTNLYIKTVANDVNDLSLKLERAINKSGLNKKVRDYKNTTQKLFNLFSDLEFELINEMKNTMSKETFRIFNEFAWKKDICSEVLIDEEYGIDVRDSKGYLGLGSLSKGELSLLALSYTLALHQISGFDGMLVIDTPVGRISDKHRTSFANVLKQVSANKQIIMLFTPSEYSDEIKPVFEKVAIEYKIITHDEDYMEVVEGRI